MFAASSLDLGDNHSTARSAGAAAVRDAIVGNSLTVNGEPRPYAALVDTQGRVAGWPVEPRPPIDSPCRTAREARSSRCRRRSSRGVAPAETLARRTR